MRRIKSQKAIGNFLAVFEVAEEGGYIVHVPMLPGCHTQGNTFEEAERNVREAIEVYLLALKDLGQEFPVSQGQSIVMNVRATLPA